MSPSVYAYKNENDEVEKATGREHDNNNYDDYDGDDDAVIEAWYTKGVRIPATLDHGNNNNDNDDDDVHDDNDDGNDSGNDIYKDNNKDGVEERFKQGIG